MVSKIGAYSGDRDGMDIQTIKQMKRRKKFKIADQGMFMIVGIQNTHFIVGKQTWVFNNGDTSSQKE